MARDTSARPHELLKIQVGDIMYKVTGTATYAELTIGKGGKTVPRTVPLTNSIPYIKDWLQEHPTGNNRNTFLFISRERQSIYRNIPLKPISVAIMYRELKLDFFPRLLTRSEIKDLKEKLEAVHEEQNQKFNQIMTMIQRNPKLANIKPEVLAVKNPNLH
jgi:hypothetical protein